MLSNNFIQVIPDTRESTSKIIEDLNRLPKINKKDVINHLKKSIAFLDRKIKQQAIKYVTQRDSQKKVSEGGLNRKKKSLKKFYKD